MENGESLGGTDPTFINPSEHAGLTEPQPFTAESGWSGIGSEMAVYSPEPPASLSASRRRKHRILAAVAVLIVVAAVGGLAALGGGGHPRSVEATVAASVGDAFASKTAAITLTMHVRSSTVDMTADGQGVMDFSRGALSASLNAHLGSNTIPATVLYSGEAIYEQIAGLDQVEPGKSWLKLDLSGVSEGTGALAGGGNPMAMLALLTKQGAVVKPVAGTTEISGVPTKGYLVNISQDMVRKELGSNKIPSWMRQAMQNIIFSGASETVYIDNSNLLRRYVIDMTFNKENQSTSIHETVDLSNYGTPAVIVTPPANQTIDFGQFLKDLQAADSAQS